MLGLKDRVAMVTGAGRGIGHAICLALASCGTKIVAVDIDSESLSSIEQELKSKGCEVSIFVADISRRREVEVVVSGCMQAMGHLDIFVNNAGINFLTPQWETIPEKEWDQVFAVNVKGPYFCICSASKPMREQGWGRIINIGSIAGKVGGPASGIHYCASKAALMCLTKNFARILAPFGITVNAVAPGLIDTEMTVDWPERSKLKYIENTPLGRLGRPDDIAGAVVYLASELACYVTGETLDVNGGNLMD
jgi:3-oxoacyl-[acyl-carrier protein] reductase